MLVHSILTKGKVSLRADDDVSNLSQLIFDELREDEDLKHSQESQYSGSGVKTVFDLFFFFRQIRCIVALHDKLNFYAFVYLI